MFWKFGSYATISPVDAILDRPDFTLEELLDESELLNDIKAHNTKLLEYIHQRTVLERLLDFVVAPKAEDEPSSTGEAAQEVAENDGQEAKEAKEAKEGKDESADGADTDRGRPRLLPFVRSRASSSATESVIDENEEAEKRRNRYAFVSCEILASDSWSICEVLIDPDNRDLLHKFWQFLKRPAPLDVLQASYFTKVNENLFDRKVEEMVDFLKSADNAVPDMLRHVDSPMIMDLLLKIITLDRPEACPGIVEWLYTQDLMPTLLSCLNPKNSWSTQTSAGDFIKAIITVSANAGQNEQTCIGPNELTRQLVSHPCIDELIGYMLAGGNALTVGVGIVIEVIRKNNSDYDPDVGTEANSIPSSRDPIYLGTLLRKFAENVPNFMMLMQNAPAQKARLTSTFGAKLEPLGFDRFKTCELMAELLHCSNMGLLNENGSEQLIILRDAERARLRREGKLTPNRGEEAPVGAEILPAHPAPGYSSDDGGRRLEVTNVSASDDDGFEEVTHAAGLAEDEQPLPESDTLPEANGKDAHSFFDKDEDEFVEEPLSSPRLRTADDNASPFDDPDLVVAPLSPSKKKIARSIDASGFKADLTAAFDKHDLPEAADYVTEANEPALGEKGKLLGSDKVDDSESSIVFTPSISSLSDTHSLGPTPLVPKPLEPKPLELRPSETEPAKPESTEPKTEAATVSASSPSETVAHIENTQSEEATASEHDAASAEPVVESAVVAPLSLGKSTTEGPTVSTHAAQDSETAVSLPIDATAESKQQVCENLTEQVTEDTKTAEPAAAPTEAIPGTADASTIVVDESKEEARDIEATDERPVEPVVGDFLKMQFVDHRVVPTILSFFFDYPWNNFLHNVVYDVVQQVFNGPMDRGYNPRLAISLFESADITTQIINGQLASERSQAETRTRMGYMGHLTLIAEEVVKFTERHPPELLSDTVLDKVMSADWINYVEGPLAETRERDNAVLGGVRPEVVVNNQAAAAGLAAVGLSSLGSSFGFNGNQGMSSALAEAGLNGGFEFSSNNDDGAGPFSISAGISSGFHSSSDEDDDDADDNDEDVNNEFRAYTDPLNASSSLLPPAIPPPPPPPPPLNIPPSRARLQLAARLAMSKRNAEAAAAQESGEGGEEGSNGSSHADNGLSAATGTKSLVGSLSPETTGTERLRNPFADDEDDDDDDDDLDDDDDDDDADLNGGDGTGRVGLGWNRGGWWRSMVRRNRDATTGGSGSSGGIGTIEQEKFGDGRDSSSSGDEDDRIPGGGVGNEEDDDDEEFGDFAMPEVSTTPIAATGTTSIFPSTSFGFDKTSSNTTPQEPEKQTLGFDQDSETVLLKPLAVHPPSASSGGSTTTNTVATGGTGTATVAGLWPFERLGFLSNKTDAKNDSEVSPAVTGATTVTPATAVTAATAATADTVTPTISTVPTDTSVPLATTTTSSVTDVEKDVAPVVVPASMTSPTAEDDKEDEKVVQATEAKRRRSLEDDSVVV